MPVNILMPALSPTMAEGNLIKWLKSEGDKVVAGDVIAEIETDKATMEVEAVDEGVLAKIIIPAGTDNVKVNELIAIILEEGEDASAIDTIILGQTATSTKQPSATNEPAHSTSHMQKSSAESAIDHGDTADQQRHHNTTSSTANTDLQTLSTGDHAAVNPADQRLIASPLARRIASHEGIELSHIAGTGPRGRIIKADVEKAITNVKASLPDAISSAATSFPKTVAQHNGSLRPGDGLLPSFDEVKLSTMRKVIARRLTESKQSVPHFYLTVDIELDALLAMRKEINHALAESERISVNDCLIKASALALKAAPAANASYADTHIRQYHAADIAVAVAIDGGLVTPVLRDADSKSLSTLSLEMRGLIAKARAGKLTPEEYQGGTFSISNLGMYGIQSFAAVINPPQGCILAIGAGEQRPVVKNGQIGVATIMSCTLSVDHRVVDGAVGAEFLKHFKRLINSSLNNVDII